MIYSAKNQLFKKYYDFYFKTVCNVNNSVTIGPIKLTTSCSSNQLPWIEDFRNLSQYGTNILPNCFKYLIACWSTYNRASTLSNALSITSIFE